MRPASCTSCGTPNPLGQSKRTGLEASSTNSPPCASPSKRPRRPLTPGDCPTGANASSLRRPSPYRGPPARPVNATWVSCSRGRAACNQARRDGDRLSLSAATASSGAASRCAPSSAKRRPPATVSPSRRCVGWPAWPICNCGASNRQPPSICRQRAVARSVVNAVCGRAAPAASGAPLRRRSRNMASTLTPTIRCCCSCAQPCTWPVPASTRIPPACSSPDQPASSAGRAAT